MHACMCGVCVCGVCMRVCMRVCVHGVRVCVQCVCTACFEVKQSIYYKAMGMQYSVVTSQWGFSTETDNGDTKKHGLTKLFGNICVKLICAKLLIKSVFTYS